MPHFKPVLLILAALLLALGLFQNCGQVGFSAASSSSVTTSTNPPPTDQPPNPAPVQSLCKGSGAAFTFDQKTLSKVLTVQDSGTFFLTGRLRGVVPQGGAFSIRLPLTSRPAGSFAVAPGASRVTSQGNEIAVSMVQHVPAGEYNLAIGPQGVRSFAEAQLQGLFVPDCGKDSVLAEGSQTKTIGMNANLNQQSEEVDLEESVHLIVSTEVSLTYVRSYLTTGVQVIDRDSGYQYRCSLVGVSGWSYASPSSPSVSGICAVTVPAGRYLIKHVVQTDASGYEGAQILSFAALSADSPLAALVVPK